MKHRMIILGLLLANIAHAKLETPPVVPAPAKPAAAANAKNEASNSKIECAYALQQALDRRFEVMERTGVDNDVSDAVVKRYYKICLKSSPLAELDGVLEKAGVVHRERVLLKAAAAEDPAASLKSLLPNLKPSLVRELNNIFAELRASAPKAPARTAELAPASAH